MKIKNKNEFCDQCGDHWDCATFLSETFNFSGGSMVFECGCGNTKSRNFIPTDLLPIEEAMKYIMIGDGMDHDIVESSVQHYKHIQSLKAIK